MSAPKWTRQQVLALDAGAEGMMRYELLRNGEPTGITQEYQVDKVRRETTRIEYCAADGARLDTLAETDWPTRLKWLEAHANAAPANPEQGVLQL